MVKRKLFSARLHIIIVDEDAFNMTMSDFYYC